VGLGRGGGGGGEGGGGEAVVQPQTVVDILHQFSDKADIIFAG